MHRLSSLTRHVLATPSLPSQRLQMFACCSQSAGKAFDYLIVGGGNSAGYACKEFVAQGIGASSVGMITAEAVLPYERPALTKAYLHPPSAKVRARLPGFHTSVGGGGERQTPEWYEEKGIEIVKGRATEVDLANKVVKVGDSLACGYKKLILATGCKNLRVSAFGVAGDELSNVFYLREEHEAAELVKNMESLEGKGRVVVLGGGYLGMETAAGLVGWGFDVTMVFPEAHILSRLFDPTLAAWMEAQMQSRGIKLVKGDTVSEILQAGATGKADSVKLKSGTALPADMVVVGVGARPIVDYCAGLEMDQGGFVVDGSMQTSDPNVFAIGDICTFPSAYGGSTRCEHVDHARKSAAQAVQAAMCKSPETYKYLPYFYSRLFEYTDAPIVFNFFGDQSGVCKTTEDGEKNMKAVWVKDGKVTGALLIGSPGPSADDMNKLRTLVQGEPAEGPVKEVFSSFGM